MTRRPAVVASAAFLSLLVLVALVGGLFTAKNGGAVFLCVSAVRSTVAVAAVVVAGSIVVGVAAAALAALGPPPFDVLLSRVIEVAGALPAVVVVAVLASVARTSTLVAIACFLSLKLGLESAKMLRAELLQLGAEGFVDAAYASGAGETGLFRRHYLGRVAGTAFARSTLGAAAVVGLDAAGSFLGIFAGGGSFGSLLAEAARRSSFGLFLFSAIATAATTSSLAVVADVFLVRARLGRRLLG